MEKWLNINKGWIMQSADSTFRIQGVVRRRKRKN